MKNKWLELLEWLRQNLPGLLLAFGLGYREGEKEKKELQKSLLNEETARKKAEDVAAVLKNNDGKSDSDVVRDILRK